jgi:hypothetical protein
MMCKTKRPDLIYFYGGGFTVLALFTKYKYITLSIKPETFSIDILNKRYAFHQKNS